MRDNSITRIFAIGFIIAALMFSSIFMGMVDTQSIDSHGTPETAAHLFYNVTDSPPAETGPRSHPAPSPHYDTPIISGWNFISFPVTAAGSPESVLNDAGGDTTWSVVKWYNPQTPANPWKTYRIGATTNDLNYIDNTMGLWVYITDPGSDEMLSVNGEEPGVTQILLYAGWNLVGYPSRVQVSASETLPLTVDIMSYYQTLSPYIIDTADLAGVTLETGHGYWVHSTSDITWDVVNPEPIRQTAEFERMQGVLIRYTLGISYDVIAEIAEEDIVYTLVRSTTVMNQAINFYGNNGVNLANCEWIIADSDSYWTRDYGPWWITDENGDFGIVDFPYNRPRPADNAVPAAVASYLGVPLDYMDVYHAGGNYMTDGQGISVSTDLVLEENAGLTETQVRQLHKDYLNIDTYHIVPDANGEYIKHIDCWAKYLDVDKIMIREVPVEHIQYDEIEAAVDYFESQISAYGTPYQVYRVYTPNDEPYSNCLILNDKVLLPIMGGSWDDEAIASYQAAMPGYEIIGFTGTWESTDALHCRTRGIPDLGMLYIQHFPVRGPKPDSEPIEIKAKITAYSGSDITAQELCWKLSTEPTYHVVPMSQVTGNQYTAFIPGQVPGVTIQYYIHASDASGRDETNPLIGIPDPHVFTVT